MVLEVRFSLFLKRSNILFSRFRTIVGGPGQIAHLAPTYAAVNALCLLRDERAYQVIDRFESIHSSSVRFNVTSIGSFPVKSYPRG